MLMKPRSCWKLRIIAVVLYNTLKRTVVIRFTLDWGKQEATPSLKLEVPAVTFTWYNLNISTCLLGFTSVSKLCGESCNEIWYLSSNSLRHWKTAFKFRRKTHGVVFNLDFDISKISNEMEKISGATSVQRKGPGTGFNIPIFLLLWNFPCVLL